MSQAGRLGLATRAFFLATVAGLALAFQDVEALQGTLLLVAVAGLAVAADRFATVGTGWTCLVEGILAGLIVGLTLPDGILLLPYLMVPTLLVGLEMRSRVVVGVAVAESASLLLVSGLGGTGPTFQLGVELAAPWAAASLGAGLMTAWILQLRGRTMGGDEASYESARRLLAQLHTVARRLSSGLDPVSICGQILSDVQAALDDTQSALFIRSESGLYVALGYRGSGARHSLLPEGDLTDECWARREPTYGVQPSGRAERRHRVVLPLRLGSRMVGVVISESGSPPDPQQLAALVEELDEHALRLDTALVFDEIRSLATSEERRRLAREIHDGVAQEIASLGYSIDDLAEAAVTEAQRSKLESLRGEISRVVSELRLSIFDLRSEVSPSAGLGSALSDYVRTVGSRTGMTVHLTLDEAPTRLREEVETELLRIAQEAVTNARRHSQASNLWVDCRTRPPFARITVEDDGSGMGTPRTDSYGLTIMRERAARIHADLEIGPASVTNGAGGTRVAVSVGEEDRRPHDARGD